MPQLPIRTFEELHKAFGPFSPNTAIFRGVTDPTYSLRPSIGRLTFHRRKRTPQQEES